MSHSRYQPVPQAEEVIDLRSYNYNTGVPTSPPPSFHSQQSAESYLERCQTPRPDDSITNANHPTGPVPWNDSNPDIDAIRTSREIMIVNLHKRVEKLEETIGRLLLEREERGSVADDQSRARSNCCVTFADPENPTAAESEILRSGSNCCVKFGRRREKSNLFAMLCWVGIILLIAIWSGLVAYWRSGTYCVREYCEGKS